MQNVDPNTQPQHAETDPTVGVPLAPEPQDDVTNAVQPEQTVDVKQENIDPFVDPCRPVDGTKFNNPTAVLPSQKILFKDALDLYNDAEKDLRDKISKQPTGKNVYDEKHPDVIQLTTMREFLAAVVASTYCNNEFINWFNRPDAEFKQMVSGDSGKQIRIAYPSRDTSENDVLSGKAALHQISRLVNYGRDTTIPNWSSGVYLEVADFQPYEMLELDIRMSATNVDLGNNTRGAVYSGDDVHINGVILDFIKAHITKTNIKGWENIDIFDVLKVTDIPSLYIGTLAAIYPAGYPLIHYCTNRDDDDVKCTYVYEAKKNADGQYDPDSLINFNRTLIPDMGRIDARSVMHMSQPMNTFAVEAIKVYQANLQSSLKVNDSVTYSSATGTKIKVVFKVPTINEYLQRGVEWISSVIEMVDKTLSTDSAIGVDDREAKRRNIINRYANQLAVVKQMAWVSHIVVYDENGGNQTINDDSTIKRTLNSLSTDKTFKAEFNKAIALFKEDSTIAMAGYPNYICPVCKKSQIKSGSKYPTLIPINPIGFFFTIIQAESKYIERENM